MNRRAECVGMERQKFAELRFVYNERKECAYWYDAGKGEGSEIAARYMFLVLFVLLVSPGVGRDMTWLLPLEGASLQLLP